MAELGRVRLTPEQIAQLTYKVKSEIDAYCIRTYDDGPRWHLGASLIGQECKRAAWYGFRWAKYIIVDGRMQRLFRRGHLEEKRFLEYLNGIGAAVRDVDTDGEQFRIKGVNGHFGGSMDAQTLLRFEDIKFPIPPMLLEFKTSGTGQKFKELVDKGVRLAKPQHFTQMCMYGEAAGFDYGLYMCTNKNDDSLHVEIVELSKAEAADGLRRAEQLIASDKPPTKISQNPAYMTCKMCDFRGICHHNMPYDKNCRSCAFSVAIDNGQWGCKIVQQIIPKDFIKTGCEKYRELR